MRSRRAGRQVSNLTCLSDTLSILKSSHNLEFVYHMKFFVTLHKYLPIVDSFCSGVFRSPAFSELSSSHPPTSSETTIRQPSPCSDGASFMITQNGFIGWPWPCKEAQSGSIVTIYTCMGLPTMYNSVSPGAILALRHFRYSRIWSADNISSADMVGLVTRDQS